MTAKAEDADKIYGLASGGDDYLSKPFNPLELTARIKAMLRRNKTYNIHHTPSDGRNEITIGDLLIKRDSAQVFVDGKEVRLTPTEFSIRITSYNVCYTKLLRSVSGLSPRRCW